MEMKTNKYFKCNLNWNFNLFSLKILFEFGLEKQAVISPKKKKWKLQLFSWIRQKSGENNKLLINKIIRVQGRFFSMKKKDLFCHALQSTKHNVKEFELSQIMHRKSLDLKHNKKKVMLEVMHIEQSHKCLMQICEIFYAVFWVCELLLWVFWLGALWFYIAQNHLSVYDSNVFPQLAIWCTFWKSSFFLALTPFSFVSSCDFSLDLAFSFVCSFCFVSCL